MIFDFRLGRAKAPGFVLGVSRKVLIRMVRVRAIEAHHENHDGRGSVLTQLLIKGAKILRTRSKD